MESDSLLIPRNPNILEKRRSPTDTAYTVFFWMVLPCWIATGIYGKRLIFRSISIAIATIERDIFRIIINLLLFIAAGAPLRTHTHAAYVTGDSSKLLPPDVADEIEQALTTSRQVCCSISSRIISSTAILVTTLFLSSPSRQATDHRRLRPADLAVLAAVRRGAAQVPQHQRGRAGPVLDARGDLHRPRRPLSDRLGVLRARRLGLQRRAHPRAHTHRVVLPNRGHRQGDLPTTESKWKDRPGHGAVLLARTAARGVRRHDPHVPRDDRGRGRARAAPGPRRLHDGPELRGQQLDTLVGVEFRPAGHRRHLRQLLLGRRQGLGASSVQGHGHGFRQDRRQVSHWDRDPRGLDLRRFNGNRDDRQDVNRLVPPAGPRPQAHSSDREQFVRRGRAAIHDVQRHHHVRRSRPGLHGVRRVGGRSLGETHQALSAHGQNDRMDSLHGRHLHLAAHDVLHFRLPVVHRRARGSQRPHDLHRSGLAHLRAARLLAPRHGLQHDFALRPRGRRPERRQLRETLPHATRAANGPGNRRTARLVSARCVFLLK
ncbi:unnamed protein product [Trichogramma brassicae]|uniref:Uncharacterized protein n=1 Tax=Trichogramma brassicae TaxID=86971 RepID=A0A6H5IDG9_9HYME|nr:unnamed protein product [Trichogramma brassicae]